MKSMVIASSFITLFAAVLMIGAGARQRGPAAPDTLTREQVHTMLAADKGAEAKAYEIAEQMSDKKLTLEVRHLYSSWREEEQWASFLQSLFLYEQSHNSATSKVWLSTWSELTGGLWVQTNMYGYQSRQILKQQQFDRVKYQDIYASLSALLPKMKDARIMLATGLMTDIFEVEDPGLFMDAWSFDLNPD